MYEAIARYECRTLMCWLGTCYMNEHILFFWSQWRSDSMSVTREGPDMNGDSFFKQLKQLCRVVEQGLQDVTQETENNQSKRGPAGAIKRLVDLKTDIQDLQVKKQICLCVSVTLFLTFSISLSLSLIYYPSTVFFSCQLLFFFFLSLSLSHSLSLLRLYLWINTFKLSQLYGNSCMKISYVGIMLQKSEEKLFYLKTCLIILLKVNTEYLNSIFYMNPSTKT